jgi:hypothetical protein
MRATRLEPTQAKSDIDFPSQEKNRDIGTSHCIETRVDGQTVAACLADGRCAGENVSSIRRAIF